MNREAAIIIDSNTSGHHPMYLREYALAFAGKGLPVLALSPWPPALDPLPPCVIWRGIPTVGWMKKPTVLRHAIRQQDSGGVCLAVTDFLELRHHPFHPGEVGVVAHDPGLTRLRDGGDFCGVGERPLDQAS